MIINLQMIRPLIDIKKRQCTQQNIVGKTVESIFPPLAAPATCILKLQGVGIFFYLGCYLSELFSLHFLGKIMVHFFCRQGRRTLTQSSYQSEKAEEAEFQNSYPDRELFGQLGGVLH